MTRREHVCGTKQGPSKQVIAGARAKDVKINKEARRVRGVCERERTAEEERGRRKKRPGRAILKNQKAFLFTHACAWLCDDSIVPLRSASARHHGVTRGECRKNQKGRQRGKRRACRPAFLALGERSRRQSEERFGTTTAPMLACFLATPQQKFKQLPLCAIDIRNNPQ